MLCYFKHPCFAQKQIYNDAMSLMLQGLSFAHAPSKAWHVLGPQGGSSSPARGVSQGTQSRPRVVVLRLQVGPVDCPHCVPPAQASVTACRWPPHWSSACHWPLTEDLNQKPLCPSMGVIWLLLHRCFPLPPPTQDHYQGTGSPSGSPLLEEDSTEEVAEEVTKEAWLITVVKP